MGTNINTSMTLIPRMHDKGVYIPQLILLGCEHGERYWKSVIMCPGCIIRLPPMTSGAVKSHGDSWWLSVFGTEASPQHLKLDTSLRHRRQYVQKMKTTLSTRVWLKQCHKTPQPHTISWKNLLTLAWANQWPASTHMVIHKASNAQRVSTITRQKAVTSHDSVTSYRSWAKS